MMKLISRKHGKARGSSRRGCSIAALVAGNMLFAINAPAQTPARLAGAIGPFSIETTRGIIEARLSRCDSNTLWVVREGAAGAFEAGLPLREVRRVVVPSPRVFTVVEQVSDKDAISATHEALDRLIATLRPFRNVPGIPYYEAILHKARLYDRQGAWRDALRLYEDLLKQPMDAPWKQMARWRAGIAFELSGDHARAAELLENIALPEDEELLSSVIFSRGLARSALNRHRDALMDFLYLVVFHPFIQNNERRGLDAALVCYAELKDWESLLKTIQWILKEYPGTSEARHAGELYAEHRAKMEVAAQFVGGETPAATAGASDKPKAPTGRTSDTTTVDVEDIDVD